MDARKMVVTLAVITLLLTSAANAAVEGSEGVDYEPGEVLIKFGQPINLYEEGGSIDTGIPEIDDVNEEIGVYEMNQLTPLPEEPVDDPRGKWTWEELVLTYEEYGLGNVYWAKFDTVNSVEYAVGLYEATEYVELAEANYYAYPDARDPDDYTTN